MAMTDGYNEYACDVQTCTHSDFAKPDTDKADSYVKRRRYDDNGVLRELMLCSEHNATYAQLVQACEAAYQAFEHDGSYTLATQGQVEELQAQLEQLQADYETMKKNRNHWYTEYNNLMAEFEEYKRTHPDESGEE